MNDSNDTIAAVATAPGRGGIGIVRVSGPEASVIATNMLGECPPPGKARFSQFKDDSGDALDEGIALFFATPRSFTGEDVLELQGHGGVVVMDRLLARVLRLGARVARPGEFSERAFLNGKIDLAQAEAIADLIEATSEQGARGAMRSLQGVFSDRIRALVEQLVEIRLFVESAIDFPDEEIDHLAESDVARRLEKLERALSRVQEKAHQGSLLRDGMSVVIAGRPNVGKSRLLNALSGRELAIVTEFPGTTRDVLREQIHIDGMPVHVIDTAGLRESEDAVEREGVRRAWKEIEQADRLLLVVDDRRGIGREEREIVARLPGHLPCTVIRNKIDLSGAEPGVVAGAHGSEIRLCALSGLGLESLRSHLRECVGFTGAEGTFIARRRHLEALSVAQRAIQRGRRCLVEQSAGELLAEELRCAQAALGEITGEFSSDDLLGRIFSSFCIGK